MRDILPQEDSRKDLAVFPRFNEKELDFIKRGAEAMSMSMDDFTRLALLEFASQAQAIKQLMGRNDDD